MNQLLRLRSRRYRSPARSFSVVTSDGVRLRGHSLGRGDVALVFCHGFVGWHQKASLVAFQEELSRRFTIYAFDFRGHGESDGVSSFGALEHLDVEAVVARARQDGFETVVTFGGSMGGIAVIRHAALLGGSDGVVAVSTPATWSGHRSRAMRRTLWAITSIPGRAFLQAVGIRVSRQWEPPSTPEEVVRMVAPTPLVIVHGDDDHFFEVGQAHALYDSAHHPKALLLANRFGHAEDGYTPGFARRLVAMLERLLREQRALRDTA